MPNGSILLGRIKIPVRKRGQGVGHQIINDLKKYADTNQLKIFLTPSDTLGGDLDLLRTFYSSLGFTKSDDVDYELMYQPKITEQIKQMLREINTFPPKPRVYEHLIDRTIESWSYDNTILCTKPKKHKWVVGDVRFSMKDGSKIVIQSKDRLHTIIHYSSDIRKMINGEILLNDYKCKIARIDYGDDFGLMAKSHIDEGVNHNRYVYHKSNTKHRDRINKNGIVPYRGDQWMSDTAIEGNAVFATNSNNPKKWFDSTWDDDVWQIDTTKIPYIEWFVDPNFTWEKGNKHIYTKQPIPRNAIKLFKIGTGKDLL